MLCMLLYLENFGDIFSRFQTEPTSMQVSLSPQDFSRLCTGAPLLLLLLSAMIKYLHPGPITRAHRN